MCPRTSDVSAYDGGGDATRGRTMQAIGRRVVPWLATAGAAGALIVVGLVRGPADPGGPSMPLADQLVTDRDQPRAGDGWRLLAAVRGLGPVDDAAVAEDDTAYRRLWEDTLGLRPERPGVDFTSEVVVWFGAVHSGTCPDLRLDDVVVDHDRDPVVVHPQITLVGAPSFCTADANPYAFVVALDRAELPAGPWVTRPDDRPDPSEDASAPPPADAGRRG